ncbi:MAG TPA: GNAT family protein [Thermomicrobiales bacterium]|nr:GNAT family protein [Thermomicrobiales bacterium]
MIQGKRVSFRAFSRDDIPTLVRWQNDGEVMQYWGERQPIVAPSAFDAEFDQGGRFARFDERGELCLCDENGRPIGRFGYKGAAFRDRHVEIFLYIGERDAQGKGYGTEAIVLMLNWLFIHRGMHRVWLTVQAENARAIHTYEKVGFIREGIFREHYFRDGAFRDEIIFGMLAREFTARYRPEETGLVVSGEIPAIS